MDPILNAVELPDFVSSFPKPVLLKKTKQLKANSRQLKDIFKTLTKDSSEYSCCTQMESSLLRHNCSRLEFDHLFIKNKFSIESRGRSVSVISWPYSLKLKKKHCCRIQPQIYCRICSPSLPSVQFHADQMGNYETKLAKLFRSLWNHLAMKKEENILITYTCHHCFSIHWKIWLTILNFCWYKLCIKTIVKFNFRTSSYNFSQFWHPCHTTNITIHLSLSIFNTIYQWGNGTTYELHSSSRPMAFVPLLKN